MFWEYTGRPDRRARRNPQLSPSLAIRGGKWKLLVNPDGADPELYDLETDRQETRNVADENPAIAERLTAPLLEWKRSLP